MSDGLRTWADALVEAMAAVPWALGCLAGTLLLGGVGLGMLLAAWLIAKGV